MSYTIKIKNDSGSIQTWAGKEFAIAEEYTVPTDNNRIKYQNNSDLLTAIGASDALVGDGTEYFTDVNDGIDWLKGNDTSPKDTDGAPLQRTKITKTGWHFQLHGLEFCTSGLASGFNEDVDGNDLGFTSLKFYNSSDVELVAGTQAELDANCVKTVYDIEIDQDIEVIGGIVEQPTLPTTDVRMWVLAIPDLTVAQGGSVPFTQGGINLRYISGNLDLDGKTPKLLPYNNTYHTNKFRIIIKHDAGVICPIHMLFKIFRENV